MRQILFFALAGDDCVSSWEIDSLSGKLNFLSQTSVSGRPAPLAVDDEKHILYVGRRDVPVMSSYFIDYADGSLNHYSDSPELIGDPATYLWIKPDNIFLAPTTMQVLLVSKRSIKVNLKAK